ncbi:MAG TPA: PepSY domain-containing protein [Sphingomicrobium sp.]|nr:PepSY domain-containing protein [Sphingomicrobium sp.]
MKKVHTHVLRVLHKWIGLVIGIQLLLWTLSGAMMAILPMDEVSGGDVREPQAIPLVPASDRWPAVRQQLGDAAVTGVSLRPLLNGPVFEIRMADEVRLFDASTAKPIAVDARLARQIASAAHPGTAQVRGAEALRELTLPVREHELPIWRVDFADEKNSSYYVSGTTGELLERRNDTWRLWDFFWMLHIMDYTERTSFNHPVIWMFGFAAIWLAVSGVWLLFRTGWRRDLAWMKAPEQRTAAAAAKTSSAKEAC